MKPKIILSTLITLFSAGISALSQTNSNPLDAAWPVLQEATNIFIGAAPVYTPHLRDKAGSLSHWGVTLFAGVPMNDNADFIIRSDYLGGDIILVNGGITIGQYLKVFKRQDGSPLFVVRPFGVLDTGTIAYGTDKGTGNIYAITGGGFSVRAFRWLKADWLLGGDYERWTGAEKSFDTYRVGLAADWHFW